jgi:hypothetical protein
MKKKTRTVIAPNIADGSRTANTERLKRVIAGIAA